MTDQTCPKCGEIRGRIIWHREDTSECLRNQLATMTKDRDGWRVDRDRVLDEQIKWMRTIEAVYPDKEYDFGEALDLLISERRT